MEFPDLNDLLDAEYFRHASAESVFAHLSKLPPPESYGCDNVQPRTLAVLTSRPEPLIRLGLARYCSNRETIASMLSEASGTIRCAALSNRNIKHGDITVRRQIPYAIYEQILNVGEPAEILALLSNPSVSHNLLGKIVARKIPALAGNPTLHLRINHSLRAAAFRSAVASNISRASMHQVALKLAKEDPTKYGDNSIPQP